MRFVNNIGAHLKRYSVMALGALVALEGAWLAIPAPIQERLPDALKDNVSLAIAAAGLVGALIKQRDLKPAEFFSGNDGR